MKDSTETDVLYKVGQEIYSKSDVDVTLSFVETNRDETKCIDRNTVPNFCLNIQDTINAGKGVKIVISREKKIAVGNTPDGITESFNSQRECSFNGVNT